MDQSYEVEDIDKGFHFNTDTTSTPIKGSESESNIVIELDDVLDISCEVTVSKYFCDLYNYWSLL